MPTIELNEWEVAQIGLHASSNAFTYAGHFAIGGNWTAEELESANRWKALSDKMSGRPPKDWTATDFPKCPNFREQP